MSQSDDIPEVLDLERTAERLMQQVDADPADDASAATARRLLTLASDLRQSDSFPLQAELHAILGWLDEAGGTDEWLERAEAYRRAIAITCNPRDGQAYLSALIDLARLVAEGR